LKDPKRIELINSGYNNPEYIVYKDELAGLLSIINSTITE